ncbi:MAG TPA: hypothetical protein VEA69_23850 [Tepidisphaeraceae bacterium]|nr:hypothetical protein [Tepidisphaeraceae bacterium]
MRTIAVLVASMLAVVPAFAADHFLTIGGGGSPQNNQVSLERNIVYFTRTLSDLAIKDARHDVFFACGNDPATRDLQFVPPGGDPPKVNLLLSRLFGREKDLWNSYRPHELKDLSGPSTRAAITKWFETSGRRLADGDRLFVHFTGHGSGGQRGQPRNTTMDLWNDGGMPVKEFTGLLDKLPAKVSVVLVMVQCHSGGFGDVIFKDATAGPVLAEQNRCGFFATWPERLAAGCTPDTVEDNYREYSTYFWAALSGKKRNGQTVERPDYDGDGKTSMAEAHAYVQLTSETVDIPMCTSDVLVRQFGRGKDPKATGLMSGSSPYDKLLETAGADQKAVLEGLSKQLGLTGADRAGAARKLASSIEAERAALGRTKDAATKEAETLRRQMRSAVLARWPEMNNAWHPAVTKAITTEADAIVAVVQGHPAFAKWEKLTADAEKAGDRSFELERKWVKCQRVMYVLDSVALAANLEKTATPIVRERYKAVRKAEGGQFGS